MKGYLSLLAAAVVLVSCDKKELPVPAYDRGDVQTVQIAMGNDYKPQIWYSLSEDRVVSTNSKAAWDLAFEAAPTGMHVFLNGGTSMKCYKTNFTTLAEVTDTAGFGANSLADMPSGNPDSTAIGDWKNKNTVYIINRGFYVEGTKTTNLGFYKFRLISEDATRYTFEYAKLKDTEVMQGTVYKDDAYNTVAYSFSTNGQVSIEPKKADYDLCFTQYTHLFYDPFQYYQVTGVLHNATGTRVAKLKKKFSEITTGDTATVKFLTRRDQIGYDWKEFNLNTNTYKVFVDDCYLVHDQKGFYYKLHFIDFVNESGAKGYPKFEFKKL